MDPISVRYLGDHPYFDPRQIKATNIRKVESAISYWQEHLKVTPADNEEGAHEGLRKRIQIRIKALTAYALKRNR